MKVVGIDVCNGGWFAVFISKDYWMVEIFKNLEDIVSKWSESELFLVNVPIGLMDGSHKERKCDIEARKFLSISSGIDLPPIPCREAICCNSFSTANIINKSLTGRYFPTRLWQIVNNIREVDNFLIKNIEYREKFKECNSEIGFYVLGSKVMRNSKAILSGYNERRDVLRKVYPNIDEILEYSIKQYRRKDLKADDVLDAVCVAINGYAGLKNGFTKMPNEAEYDSNGIKMQIEVANYSEIYNKSVI
jgi:predicted RNase H-like nuclease